MNPTGRFLGLFSTTWVIPNPPPPPKLFMLLMAARNSAQRLVKLRVNVPRSRSGSRSRSRSLMSVLSRVSTLQQFKSEEWASGQFFFLMKMSFVAERLSSRWASASFVNVLPVLSRGTLDWNTIDFLQQRWPGTWSRTRTLCGMLSILMRRK